MKKSKQILSLAAFILMMTSCKMNFAVIKQIGEKEILLDDADTKIEKIFVFNRKIDETTEFIQYVHPGDTALIRSRKYDKNIPQVIESRDSRIYFNMDSICARYEREKFNAVKQSMTTQNVR